MNVSLSHHSPTDATSLSHKPSDYTSVELQQDPQEQEKQKLLKISENHSVCSLSFSTVPTKWTIKDSEKSSEESHNPDAMETSTNLIELNLTSCPSPLNKSHAS